MPVVSLSCPIAVRSLALSAEGLSRYQGLLRSAHKTISAQGRASPSHLAFFSQGKDSSQTFLDIPLNSLRFADIFSVLQLHESWCSTLTWCNPFWAERDNPCPPVARQATALLVQGTVVPCCWPLLSSLPGRHSLPGDIPQPHWPQQNHCQEATGYLSWLNSTVFLLVSSHSPFRLDCVVTLQ